MLVVILGYKNTKCLNHISKKGFFESLIQSQHLENTVHISVPHPKYNK